MQNVQGQDDLTWRIIKHKIEIAEDFVITVFT